MDEKEELLARKEIAAEVWGDAPASGPQDEPVSEAEPEIEQQTDEVDWAGVSPALRKTIEGISGRLATLDTIDQRLKSAEGRIGSVQQAVFEQRKAAEEAAKRVQDAPTKEQMAKAAKSERAWEDLKEEFPGWSEALHDEITGMRKAADALKQDLEALRSMQQAGGGQQQDVARMQREIDVKLVSVKHPGWQKIVQGEEFGQWLQSQDQAVQQTFLNSTDPVECIAVLDAFTGSNAGGNAHDIAASRQRRLESAATVNKGRSTQTKNPDNMTEAEYRAHVAKEIWSD